MNETWNLFQHHLLFLCDLVLLRRSGCVLANKDDDGTSVAATDAMGLLTRTLRQNPASRPRQSLSNATLTVSCRENILSYVILIRGNIKH